MAALLSNTGSVPSLLQTEALPPLNTVRLLPHIHVGLVLPFVLRPKPFRTRPTTRRCYSSAPPDRHRPPERLSLHPAALLSLRAPPSSYHLSAYDPLPLTLPLVTNPLQSHHYDSDPRSPLFYLRLRSS